MKESFCLNAIYDEIMLVQGDLFVCFSVVTKKAKIHVNGGSFNIQITKFVEVYVYLHADISNIN